jgi:hypothetical protein
LVVYALTPRFCAAISATFNQLDRTGCAPMHIVIGDAGDASGAGMHSSTNGFLTRISAMHHSDK